MLASTSPTAIFKRFAADRQRIDLSISTATSAEVSDHVWRGEAMIGLRYLLDIAPDLVSEHIASETMARFMGARPSPGGPTQWNRSYASMSQSYRRAPCRPERASATVEATSLPEKPAWPLLPPVRQTAFRAASAIAAPFTATASVCPSSAVPQSTASPSISLPSTIASRSAVSWGCLDPTRRWSMSRTTPAPFPKRILTGLGHRYKRQTAEPFFLMRTS
jgi:hypothetical protein